MQIFLTSHTHSSSRTFSRKEGRRSARGFTLIELLISFAIIGIITAIVLFKYSSFDSTTLLKGAAYEIALNLREAQVKSVSVVRNNDNNNFDNPYGISFTPGEKTYQAFSYKDEAIAPPDRLNPKYDTSGLAVKVGETTLDRGMYVKDVCVWEVGGVSGNYNCAVSRLDISFRRPEFNSLFYVVANGYTTNNDMKVIPKVRIQLSSKNNADAGFYIEVTKLGQISINSK